MTNHQFLSVNFRLTGAAAKKIAALTEEASVLEGQTMTPVIGWHEEYEEADRRLVEQGISLGWFRAGEIPEDNIQSVDGVRLVFGAWPKQAHKFEGRVIDFADGHFIFLEARG